MYVLYIPWQISNYNKSTAYRSIKRPKEMHTNGTDFITNIRESMDIDL